MVYVFLADGFEEIEALTPVDYLRRCGVEVTTVGVTGKKVTGSHNIIVEADVLPTNVDLSKAEMILLPGGIPVLLPANTLRQFVLLLQFLEKKACFVGKRRQPTLRLSNIWTGRRFSQTVFTAMET